MEAMEKLSAHIRSLLRDHDRAFIPGFGGFVKERVPARIDRGHDLFLPPTCTLSFNQRLGKEDGLLAERIMEAEERDFESAKQKIRETAEEWQNNLAKLGRLELEGIGILYQDEEGRTHFEPDPEPELEPSAFGLPSFFVQPVRQMHPIPGEEKEEEEKERASEPVPKEEKEGKEERDRGGNEAPSKRIPLKRIAAVLIPLVLMLTLGAIRMQTLSDGAHFSEFFGIGHSGKADYDPRKGTTFPDITLPVPEKEKKEPPFSFRLRADGPEYKVIRDNTAVASNEKDRKKERAAYYVVGGCFEVKGNAKKRVKRLKREGFPARLLKRKRKGLHVVAFDAYPEKRDALKGLSEARRAMPDAWLLHWP